jgi:molybdenum transport protein
VRRQAPEKKLAIEAASVEGAKSAIEAGFDVIQLEIFAVERVAEVAAFARARPSRALIAAAGGVNASNAAAYVRAGAGLIVTSAPYSAPPRDAQVAIAPIL